ncbi:MAG: hypothetical protein M1819_005927 [Sarea resinae]|nr:MAG: hypothetical protein M1819_005927 [Sarea resinae]
MLLGDGTGEARLEYSSRGAEADRYGEARSQRRHSHRREGYHDLAFDQANRNLAAAQAALLDDEPPRYEVQPRGAVRAHDRLEVREAAPLQAEDIAEGEDILSPEARAAAGRSERVLENDRFAGDRQPRRRRERHQKYDVEAESDYSDDSGSDSDENEERERSARRMRRERARYRRDPEDYY